jgi:hypothetical protein
MRTPILKAAWGVKVARIAVPVLLTLGCSGKPLDGGGSGGSAGFGGAPCTAANGCGGGGSGGSLGAAGGSPGTGGLSCQRTDSCGGTSGGPVDAGAVCEQLAERYQTVLAAARFCTPGAPNQCQSLVANVPSNCPGSVCSELMYVNDGASVEAARESWLGRSCAPNSLCIEKDCGTPPGVCSPDGICVFAGADGGTGTATDGGSTDVAPDGGESCAQLAADYAAAVKAAQACTPGAQSQCQVPASTFATTCPITGCGDETYVNSTPGVDDAISRWLAQCGQPVACPDILCVPPQLPAYTCVASGPSDAGTARGTCTPSPEF